MNIINYSNITDLRVKVGNRNFSNINFYLTTNLNYDNVNLNGLNWSLRMTIYEVENKIKIPKEVNQIEGDTLQKEKDELIQKLRQLKADMLKE
jgi:hypothetical protein